MSNFCPWCGKQVEPSDLFCIYCGKQLEPNAPVAAEPAEVVPAPEPVMGSAPAESVVVATAMAAEPAMDTPPPAVATAEPPVPAPLADPIVAESAAEPLLKMSADVSSDASSIVADEPTPEILQEGADANGNIPESDSTVSPLSEFASDNFSDDEDEPTIVVPLEKCFLQRRQTGERIALDLPAVVGRGSRADARVKGNPTISRQHAQVYRREDDVYLICDLGSTNRTYVNGLVLASQGCAQVESGDTVGLGDEDFTFYVE